MSGETRVSGLPRARNLAGAFLAAALLFVACAAATPVRHHPVPIVLWALIFLGIVAAGVMRLGPLYGVPLAIAAGVAFDSFYIPPTREFDSRDWENFLVVLLYLALAVMVGALADASRRRAKASEEQRGLLADEQAALRRLATLVARGVEPSEVFLAAAVEMRDLLGVDSTRIARFELDATATIVAESGPYGHSGARWELEPSMAITEVFRAGHAARADDYSGAPPRVRERFERLGVRASVASPVVVAGRLWGATVVSSASTPLPPGTEQRMVYFTDLLAIAIANADGRAQLTASRARIVATADDTRRKIERDLHDGVQQRLVSLALALRRAARRVPPELSDLEASLSQTVEDINEVTGQLREISRGIHPAILSQGGLAPALRTLARRSPLPVTVTAGTEARLPEHVEVAAYYVVAEALSNVAKHARASGAEVEVQAVDGTLRLRVRDDGVGGADPSRGSGLTGLWDRVEALGGSIAVESPRGAGTAVEVTLPIRDAQAYGRPEIAG
ncbi:DUF4118 domain-containing protein [Candidatus Solirubrobacter pratensis]|uniref:DUF4118 domain-containing protein n=1 Tax=Candidatus Solirubrobacter pratensis TaxID=1298857 RepID=UPI0009DBF555|nr:DUF4118 domain-containing protein [Candidatus Solirubrobacter pratensis]